MAKRRTAPPEPVAPEDAALFRAAIGVVRELPPAAPPPTTKRPAPEPRQRDADEAAALIESRLGERDAALMAGNSVEYLKSGHSPRLLRSLRRGQFSLQDEIDLHRMTARQAETALRDFLRECRDAGHLCLRIVHGKGLRSGPEGPVLKGLVEQTLRLRADVLAFASAPAAQGGTGAVLLLLAPRDAGSSS